jgi:hypothetical protein
VSGRGAIEALLDLLDEAFRGRGIEASNESQALLTNLATVTDEQQRALPARATRTIEAIGLHAGACKVMYDDYAFGSGTLRFGTPAVEPWGPDGPAPRDELVGWLEDAHARFREHVAFGWRVTRRRQEFERAFPVGSPKGFDASGERPEEPSDLHLPSLLPVALRRAWLFLPPTRPVVALLGAGWVHVPFGRQGAR